MLSKNKTITLIFTISGLLFSCGPAVQTDNHDDDYRVGEKLESKSSLASYSGSTSKIVALYDSTVSKIQMFDLESKKHIKTLNTGLDKSSKEHFLLYSEAGNYVIELTQKGFSIIKNSGEVIDNPIRMIGLPTSASFRPELGLLVVQDDANSVGILKIDTTGDVLKSWVGGSKIDPASDASLASADMNEIGDLIASLTDGQILKIDLDSTLTLKRWVIEKKGTLTSKAKWIATLSGQPNRVLIRASTVDKEHNIILYDLATQSTVDSKTVNGYLENSGRFFEPHIVINNSSYNELSFITTDGSKIISNTFQHRNSFSNIDVISSIYDRSTDTLSYVQLEKSYYVNYSDYSFFSLNTIKDKRTFKKFKMADYLLISEFAIPNNTTIDFSSDFVFSLYPNKTGYATVFNDDGKVNHEYKFFNRKSLKK